MIINGKITGKLEVENFNSFEVVNHQKGLSEEATFVYDQSDEKSCEDFPKGLSRLVVEIKWLCVGDISGDTICEHEGRTIRLIDNKLRSLLKLNTLTFELN
ncbi:hypothetical protein [Aliikangiella sp. G2MR2-5]|uniref:hypothetical protein n=1 Tax=Aliikangiella sp. G2MR2-5 TaxID=2788943 RepID=UPI0018A8BDEE|nr:hypothetical protein [Aliikangiella sp. G2MR2-5]